MRAALTTNLYRSQRKSDAGVQAKRNFFAEFLRRFCAKAATEDGKMMCSNFYFELPTTGRHTRHHLLMMPTAWRG